jgi:phage terminase Nu1 subunit (DNA packaging protein)
MELHPGDRVELPRQVADSLIVAGMAEELPPTAKVRRRRKYHLGTPEDRFIGAVLYALDFTEAEIARILGRDGSTIWRWKRRAVSVPRGRGRWKSWEAFRSAFGPPTPLALTGVLAEEPFAQAIQEALRRAAARGQYAIYNRLLNMVQTAVGAAVLGVLAGLPCPRCRRAIRPLDRARVALLHEDCFRQAFQPGAWSLPVRPCLPK